MSAMVYPGPFSNGPSSKARQVKNLGWLIRHGADVRKIELFSNDNAHLIMGIGKRRHAQGPNDYGAGFFMIAHLFDGTTFVSSYASKEVFTWWIKRNRNMKHARVLDCAHFFDTTVIQAGAPDLGTWPSFSPLVIGTRGSWWD